MKILFIWPNFDCPIGLSIGIAYLSGALKEQGHDTRIIHICDRLGYPYDQDRIESDVKAYAPDLIAFSTGQNHYPEMTQLAAQLKAAVDKPILFGGVHTTLNTPSVMNDNLWLDFANVGEGDDSLLDLVDALDRGADTSSIPNVWARRGDEVIANAARPLKNLSRLPWMDLDGWEFQTITENRRGWVNVSFNRGCPYRCTYCHNNGIAKVLQQNFGTKTSNSADLGYIRSRGIEDMLSELKHIAGYGYVRAFSFIDDTFTQDRQHTLEFLVRYKEEVGLPFVCNTTVMDVDAEILSALKDAGCDLVRFGVETASHRIRREILKRNFPDERAEEAFKICRKLGLRSFAYNILANPTESREEMLETLRLNTNLLPDGLRIALGYPYKGTEYAEIAQNLGVVAPNRHVHNYLDESILLWSDSDRLFIDKLRAFYWWWMNSWLENRASPIYQGLVQLIEKMDAESWNAPGMQRDLQNMDQSLSKILKAQDISHYNAAFGDRLDICVLHQAKEELAEEYLDEH